LLKELLQILNKKNSFSLHCKKYFKILNLFEIKNKNVAQYICKLILKVKNSYLREFEFASSSLESSLFIEALFTCKVEFYI